MKEWEPGEAKLAIAKVLLESNYGKETDMTDDEAFDLADAISKRLERGPEE